MKIVLYIHCLNRGGTERMTTHLANYWASHGHEVSIVCNAHVGSIAYQLNPDVNYVNMDVASESGNSLNAILNNFKIFTRFRRELKRLEPDYLIAMAPTVNVIAALASVGLNVTRLGAEQNYPPAEGIGSQWEFLRKYLYKLLDGVVAQTETTRQWLGENTNAKNIAVIHGPVVYPLERNEPMVQPDPNDDRKTILAVGRLSSQKQFDHLIKSFELTREKCPDWKLVILGEGELRRDIESLVAELKLADSVLLPGVAGNVGDWYTSSEIFALSSAYEGFPNVLIEALAHGLPAVCYDCNTGPRDMIVNDFNGSLVAPDNIEAFSDDLLELMQDEEKRRRLGKNAKSIADKLSIGTICAQWVSTLEAASLERNHRSSMSQGKKT